MIVHEHVVCARLHLPPERRRGDQPLKCRGAGMADLICLDNFTSDNRKTKFTPKTCAIASGIALKPVNSSVTTGRRRVG